MWYVRPSYAFCAVSLCAASVQLGLCSPSQAQTVWTGPVFSFTKESGSDYSLPENQDALTPNVIFTRGETGGLINYALETEYVHFLSPDSTLWATDLNNDEGKTIAAGNYAELSFTSWIEAFGGQFSGGGNIIGRDSVVHLVTDNIYLDLTFTDWVSARGGGFTYLRTTPAPVIVPTGDYNGDLVVNAADYVVWRNRLGQSASPKGSGADGDGDGVIGPGDYLFWKMRYGNVVGGAGQSTSVQYAVPEPFGGALFAAAGACCFPFFGRRRIGRLADVPS